MIEAAAREQRHERKKISLSSMRQHHILLRAAMCSPACFVPLLSLFIESILLGDQFNLKKYFKRSQTEVFITVETKSQNFVIISNKN